MPDLAELVRSERFDEAALYLSKLEEERRLTPAELVLKGRLIQLGSASNALSLEDAEAAFHSALSMDPDYVPALLELGWFLHAVEDDTTQGLSFFERALDVCRNQMSEAVRGKMECLEELESEEAAQKFLKKLRRELLSQEEI
jgi:tetratricopeptide (TPR) repeat protein